MERLIINTGLAGFIMPDRITLLTDTTIEAIKIFDESSDRDYIRVETMAQICALHARYFIDFQKHAFLLKINEFNYCANMADQDEVIIHAAIVSSAKEAFLYTVSATQNDRELFNGKLLIAVTDYSDTFNKETLEQHYRNLFSCLTKDL